MPKIQPIRPISLAVEINKLKHPSKKLVQSLYGTFGLDIYEKKPTITILSQSEKSIMGRINAWFMGNKLLDYNEDDSLKDVILKFAGNKNSELVENIETKFGSRGIEELEKLARLGYINL